MDHLVCFVRDARAGRAAFQVRERHMDAAARLAETCYQMCAIHRSRARVVRFVGNGRRCIAQLLRPDAIEALFYMWRFTRTQSTGEVGRCFSHSKHCKVTGGYVGLHRNDSPNAPRDDKMETPWLAESLKYFLLLFSDDALLDLNTHVLNTRLICRASCLVMSSDEHADTHGLAGGVRVRHGCPASRLPLFLTL